MNEQQYIYDKVAEAYEFLSDQGIDPVEAIAFADEFQSAPNEYLQDKVASEWQDVEEGDIEKIAEAVNYLSDIEGVPLVELMYEYEKDAKEHKKDDYQERARKIARNNSIAGALIGAPGSSAVGLYEGSKRNHAIVGGFTGGTGVNGAVAKDTGKSTLNSTIRGGAEGGAMTGTASGAILGGAAAHLMHKREEESRIFGKVKGRGRKVIAGAALGSATGAVLGTAGGAINSAAGYGLGHLFGSDQKGKNKKHKEVEHKKKD